MLHDPTAIPSDLAHALKAAGSESLAPGPRAWLDDRISRYGSTATNPGLLRCSFPHRHDDPHEDHRCEVVTIGGVDRRVAIFDRLGDGAETFVATARRAGASRPGELAGSLEGDKIQALRTDGVDVGLWPFGPSEDAERRFRELRADWEAFDRAGLVTLCPELAPHAIHWASARAKWDAGDPDVTDLQALESEANTARECLRRKAPPDAQWSTANDRKGGDQADTTPLAKGGSFLDALVQRVPALASLTDPAGPKLPELPRFGKAPSALELAWAVALDWAKENPGKTALGAGIALYLIWPRPRVIVAERADDRDRYEED